MLFLLFLLLPFYGERDFFGNSILDMNRNRRKYNLMEAFILLLLLLLRLLRCLVPINDQSKIFMFIVFHKVK